MDNPVLIGAIVGVGLPAIIGIALGVVAKIFPRQKCAEAAWGVVCTGLNIADKFLDLKIGDKLAEKVEEEIVGTVGYVFQFVGFKTLLWLRGKDTDGSQDIK